MRLLLLTITAFGFMCITSAVKAPAKKILLITVDEIGTVTIGRDTINVDNLARYIQERLFKSYMGTGKMHDRIDLTKEKEVPETVLEVITKEIQQGQLKALTEVCLQKYRKRFENLEERKQDKIKRQFPVLFQTFTNKAGYEAQ